MKYEYMPQRNIKKITAILVMLISAAVGFALFTSLYPDMQMIWIFQLSVIICVCGVIFIASRYIGKAIVYSIIEDDGALYFGVTEVTNGGRKRIMVCRFALSEVESVEYVGIDPEKKKALAERIKRERRQSYNYCAEISDPNTYCVFISQNGNKAVVKISPDSVIFDYLTKKGEGEENF